MEQRNGVLLFKFLWKGKTYQGMWNIARLRLASEARIKQRKDRKIFIEAVEEAKKLREQLRQDLILVNESKAEATTITVLEKNIEKI